MKTAIARAKLILLVSTVLTVTILFFPVHLTLKYQSIQSICIFDNLLLFGILYYTWLALILLALFSSRKSEDRIDFEKFILTCLFSVVFLGFWIIITRGAFFAVDGAIQTDHIKYVLEVGHTVRNDPNFGYFDFPGLHFLFSGVSLVLGVKVLDIITPLLTFRIIILSTLLYIFYSKILDAYLAPLATLLTVQGNWMLAKLNFLHPSSFALIFLAIFLVLLTRHEHALFERSDIIVVVIVITVTTITHFVTSISFFFILFGIYLLQKFSKVNILWRDRWIITLSLLIPLSWELSLAIGTFSNLIEVFVRSLKEMKFLEYLSIVARPNIGMEVPLWANTTRLFWLTLIFICGTLLGLANMVKIRKLGWLQKRETGALFGIIILTAVAILPLGGVQYYRFLMYGSFFTVPILLRFLTNLGKGKREIFIKVDAVALLIVLFFTLSLPTFLAHNDRINIDTYYPYELSIGGFLGSVYGKGDGVTAPIVLYYMPNGHFRTEVAWAYVKDKEEAFRSIDNWLQGFLTAKNEVWQHEIVLLFSKRFLIPYERDLGINSTDPYWSQLRCKLQYVNRVYDNQHAQIHT